MKAHERAAADWEPTTRNHDPRLIAFARECYAAGYEAGAAEIPRVCVAVVVRDDEQRVLLLRRSATRTFPGTWCLPGGHLAPGETLEECCRRELLEETGLSAEWFTFDVVTEILGPPHLIGHVYRADGVTGTAVNAEPHAHDAIGWLGSDSRLSPLMPGVVQWLQSLDF